MGQPIPAQHPSVVLRSHFKLVKGLLAVAMVAVLALTAAVVILANDEDNVDTASKATPAVVPQPQVSSRGIVAQPQTPGTRFDGGPEEGTRGLIAQPKAQPQTAPGTRFDGGPEEGTRGLIAQPKAQPQTPPGPASTAAPRRAPAARGRTTSSPARGRAISRPPPTASRSGPAVRG